MLYQALQSLVAINYNKEEATNVTSQAEIIDLLWLVRWASLAFKTFGGEYLCTADSGSDKS